MVEVNFSDEVIEGRASDKVPDESGYFLMSNRFF